MRNTRGLELQQVGKNQISQKVKPRKKLNEKQLFSQNTIYSLQKILYQSQAEAYFILLLVSITQLMGCTQTSTPMNIEEPSYYLQLDTKLCPHVITVNGIQITAEYEGSADNSRFPINPYIRNGQNQFELQLPPEDELKQFLSKDSLCSATIGVKGYYKGNEVDFVVANIVFTPNSEEKYEERHTKSIQAGNYRFEESGQSTLNPDAADASIGEITKSEDYFEDGDWFCLQRTFTANVDFPEWAFFSAEKIFTYPMDDDKYDSMAAQVWPLVLELWDLFEKKDLDQILPLFEFRSKEYDLAFYRPEGETLKLLKESIQSNYNEDYPILRQDKDYMQMYVAFNERLVSMKNAGSGNGTVMFYYQEADMNIFYDVYWMKIDGKWVIGR